MDVEPHDEVDQWLEDLSDSEWLRASIVIDRLASLGHTARMPFSRALGDGVFEARFTLGHTAGRITYRFTQDQRIVLRTTFRKTKQKKPAKSHEPAQSPPNAPKPTPKPRGSRIMANYSRWETARKNRATPTDADIDTADKDFALGQLIYDLRTAAELSQSALAKRMGTTQSVISRLEEGGGARNRIDTLARVAAALDRHLIVSFPETVPEDLTDAVQVA